MGFGLEALAAVARMFARSSTSVSVPASVSERAPVMDSGSELPRSRAGTNERLTRGFQRPMEGEGMTGSRKIVLGSCRID